MAEKVEIAYLKGKLMSPERVIEIVREGYVDHYKREGCGENQYVSAIGIVLVF